MRIASLIRMPTSYRANLRRTLKSCSRALLNDQLWGTGIGWEDLPQELGFRSGTTSWRRIKRWNSAGVFDDLHRILLAQLNAANEIDWSRAVIDGSHIDAKRGPRTLSSPPFPAPT